jgi:hypothetical protein
VGKLVEKEKNHYLTNNTCEDFSKSKGEQRISSIFQVTAKNRSKDSHSSSALLPYILKIKFKILFSSWTFKLIYNFALWPMYVMRPRKKSTASIASL